MYADSFADWSICGKSSPERVEACRENAKRGDLKYFYLGIDTGDGKVDGGTI